MRRAETTDLRVLYADDDPALCALVADWLRGHDDVADVHVAADAAAALRAVDDATFDVALLDVSFGASRVNGYELGLAIRAKARTMPIVMFSQHPPARVEDVLPARERHHWSYVRKDGGLDVDALVDVIHTTMLGVVAFEGDPGAQAQDGAEVLQRLSPRQREVMALAATGLDARAIADHLHLAHVSVRRELSRAYKVLVPDAPAGTDLRTAAVLAYLRHADPVVAI